MIAIRRLGPYEPPSIYEEGLRIIRDTQGPRSVADTHVYNYATGEGSCAFGAFFEEKLIGVATAVIRGQNEFSLYQEHTPAHRSLTDSTSIGFLRSMSVIPSFQGKGIGKALVSERLKWMKNNGAQRAWVMSWVNGREYNSENVFKSMNFERIALLPDFFKSAACLVCGEHCRCSIGIYILEL